MVISLRKVVASVQLPRVLFGIETILSIALMLLSQFFAATSLAQEYAGVGERREGKILLLVEDAPRQPFRSHRSEAHTKKRTRLLESPEEVTTQDATPVPPLRIGRHRDIPALNTPNSFQDGLVWHSTSTGRQVAAVSVTSPEAKATRVAIRAKQLPDGAVVRFYTEEERRAFEVTGKQIADTIKVNVGSGDTTEQAWLYWSPTFDGAEISVEIELPEGYRPEDIDVSAPLISHLVVSAGNYVAIDGQVAGSCNIDVTCYQGTWSSQSRATAVMTYNDSTGSYKCTGTLVNDWSSGSSTPYLLSANHCISNQTVASTLQTYWFYTSATCDDPQTNSGYQHLPGGAIFLYNSADTDTSLLRLNAMPPAGASYSGWWATLPATGSSLTGIHHPRGDMQKISFGSITGYDSCTSVVGSPTFTCSSATAVSANHVGVQWGSGTVESGSSGSGLYLNSGQYLVGTLHGGSCSCSNPTGPSYYGRFDLPYNAALKHWLGTSSQPNSLSVQISGLGSGTVTSASSDIVCSRGVCAMNYAAGAAITLTPTANAGSVFSGWTGNCSGTGSCSLTMNSSKWITAKFDPSRPDLVVSSISAVSPVQAGGSISISITAKNIGTAATAAASRTRIYLSTNNIISSFDTSIGYCDTPPVLAVGQTYACAGNLTIPASLSPGVYYIGAIADSLYAVVETNEANNFSAGNLVTIGVPTSTTSTLSISVTGGSGTILAVPPTFWCSSNCNGTFAKSATITLEPLGSGAAKQMFAGWGGACTGFGECTVTMSANKSVTAAFAPAGAIFQVPWFTNVTGYISRFVMLNSGTSTAHYSATVLAESGNSVAINGNSLYGSIPPRSQFVLNIGDLIRGFSAAQRAMLVIATDRPSSEISGIYNLVQPATGAITNSRFLEARDFSALSSTLLVPWFTTSSAYSSSIVLTNTGSYNVSATVSFLTTANNSVVPGTTSYTVPAYGQLIIDIGTLVRSFTGTPPVGAATIAVNAPEGQVKGSYKVVHIQSGSASNTELINPQVSTSIPTTLVMPWFSTAAGYSSSFIFTNRGATDATFSVSVITEPGNSVVQGQTTGVIPAQGQLILPASNIVSTFTGSSRAGVVFTINGANSDIEGMYQIQNTATGALSNTIMARPSTSSGTTPIKVPWFSTASGYISRFVLMNRGSNAAPYTIDILPEAGNVGHVAASSGTVPANSIVVLNASDIVPSFLGATRAGAVFHFSAPDFTVDGLFNIVNPLSGAITNTMLVR